MELHRGKLPGNTCRRSRDIRLLLCRGSWSSRRFQYKVRVAIRGCSRTLNLICYGRSFEYLGATSSFAITRSPGEHSFTRALIWALTKFAKGERMFTTTELVNKIREAPKFPKKQVPVLQSRDSTSFQRIILSPVPSPGSQEEAATESPNRASTEILKLQFHFEKPPTDTELKELAGHLVHHIKLQRGNLHRVSFGGVSSVIHMVLSRWRGSSNSSQTPSPSAVVSEGSRLLPQPAPGQRPALSTNGNHDCSLRINRSNIEERQQLSGRLVQRESKQYLLKDEGICLHFKMFWIALWLSVLSCFRRAPSGYESLA